MQEPYLSQVKGCNLACSPSCDHQTLPSVGDGISVGTGNSCGMSEATKVRMIQSVVFECVHILAYIYVHIYIVVICKHRYVYIHVWIRYIYYLFSSFGWVVCTVDLCILFFHDIRIMLDLVWFFHLHHSFGNVYRSMHQCNTISGGIQCQSIQGRQHLETPQC